MILSAKEFVVLSKSNDILKQFVNEVVKVFDSYSFTYTLKKNSIMLVKDFRPVKEQIKELMLYMTYSLGNYTLQKTNNGFIAVKDQASIVVEFSEEKQFIKIDCSMGGKNDNKQS